MNRSEVVQEAAKAAYPELYDPANQAWLSRGPAERAHYQSEIMARIARAVDVVQANAPHPPEQSDTITLTLFAPDAQIVVATFGVVSFLDGDGVEHYAMAHSEGASRATLLGMLTMASHEIVTAPGGAGPVEP